MSARDFTTVLTVNQTPQEAFAAINDVRGWWPGIIEGRTDKLGEEFTYRYEDVHYSKQKLTELIPGKRVAWRVVDSALKFSEDKSEWTGTDITFDISTQGDKTEIRFTHRGLTPDFECFTSCSNAWSAIINEGLHGLIATGKRTHADFF